MKLLDRLLKRHKKRKEFTPADGIAYEWQEKVKEAINSKLVLPRLIDTDKPSTIHIPKIEGNDGT